MAARIRRPGDVLSMVGVLSFSLRLCDMMKVIKKGGRAILRENAHFTNNFHLEYFRIIPFLMTSYMSATLRLDALWERWQICVHLLRKDPCSPAWEPRSERALQRAQQ